MADCTVSLNALTQDNYASEDARAFAARNQLVMVGPTFSLRNDESIYQQALDAAAPISEMALDCVSFMFGFGDGSAALAITSGDMFVRLTPPPPGSGMPEVYYQYAPNDWRRVANQRLIDDKALFVVPSFFAFYQVFAVAAEIPFSFGEVYVYPNPSGVGDTPVLRVEIGLADSLSTRIYDVSGDLVLEGRLDGAPVVGDGKVAYEMKLATEKLRSGVYIGVVTAEREGKQAIRRQYRFTVVK